MLRTHHAVPCAMLCLAGAGLLLGGCAGDAGDETPPEVARNVRVMPLEVAPLAQYLELAGPMLPVRGADIAAEESGTVVRVDHDKGETVAAGAPLLTLDRRLLAAELDAAEAALELAAYNHDRMQQLREAGKISELELLQSRTELRNSRSRHDIARTRHERARVRAPFAGLVARREVEPGELVMPGMQVARVIDPYVLELAGALSEQEVAWVREGMPAEVRVAGVDDPVAGTVAWVGFEAGASTGKFPVEIHVPNPDLALRGGVIGRARVVRGTTDGLVAIPRDAVMPGDGVDHVFVVEGDRARKRTVTLGPGQGLMVAVREGLAPGDLLVVRGHRDLRDGSLVEIGERVPYGDGTDRDDPDVLRAASAGPRGVGEAGR